MIVQKYISFSVVGTFARWRGSLALLGSLSLLGAPGNGDLLAHHLAARLHGNRGHFERHLGMRWGKVGE